ncbi:MAG TPA: hypothetical protein VEP90_25025 [Methylomirabilota bacterium]|nr:hypothetical protein [Methylomirabilota bacterium]
MLYLPVDTIEVEYKEVYATFGLAVYLAQCFERQLGITLATVCLSDPDSVTREQYDALLSKNFKKTLGQLFYKMKDDLNIADEIKQEIEAALQLRNFLIHNYFWERMLQFNASAGRQAMLEELYHACTVFQEVDSKVEAITKAWGEKRGVTEQDYAEELEKLLKSE